jgi:UDP-GlcNAc:undecaprenyl-phosphate GlcNAc-1-phosphate transferase
MLFLGIYDDFKGADAFKKLFVQISVALVLYYFGYRIESLSNPFGSDWVLGVASLPVTLLWIVGITNAINLLDGIDGLAVGITASTALTLSAINILGGQTMVALLCLCLAGACLGFLPYNFSPARIFLGDSGSLFLGLVLSSVSILSSYKAATATFVAMPIYMVFLFGLPLIDTASVFIGRLLSGRSVFKADMTHVHHRLLRFGWTQKQAAYILYSLSVGFGLVSMMMSFEKSPFLVLIGGLLILVVLGIIYRSEHFSKDR